MRGSDVRTLASGARLNDAIDTFGFAQFVRNCRYMHVLHQKASGQSEPLLCGPLMCAWPGAGNTEFDCLPAQRCQHPSEAFSAEVPVAAPAPGRLVHRTGGARQGATGRAGSIAVHATNSYSPLTCRAGAATFCRSEATHAQPTLFERRLLRIFDSQLGPTHEAQRIEQSLCSRFGSCGERGCIGSLTGTGRHCRRPHGGLSEHLQGRSDWRV